MQTNADAPQPAPENQNGVTSCPPGFTDAVNYLDAVKSYFHDRPNMYNVFLKTLRDFRRTVIDTPGMIQRVSNLFRGRPFLIQGFNTFLPVGYHIEVSPESKSSEVITVTTPSGRMLRFDLLTPDDHERQTRGPAMEYVQRVKTHFSNDPGTYKQFLEIIFNEKRSPDPDNTWAAAKVEELFKDALDFKLPSTSLDFLPITAMIPSMKYIQHIKTRFSNDPDTYKQFEEIRYTYKSSSANNAEVVAKVEELFKVAPDLSSTFLDFLLGIDMQDNVNLSALRRAGTYTGTSTGEQARARKRKQPAESATLLPFTPTKRRR